MKKTLGILVIIFSIASIANAGGVHIKGCTVKCSPHVRLFPKFNNSTTTSTDDTRKKKRPRTIDWPWWLGY